MSGSTEKHFTATGPATIGFQTRPPDTNTHFDVGVEVSGLSLGVKGTGTRGERSPPVPDSGGTGVQGNGSGIGSGVAGFGGNATPGTTGSNPTWCAGVLGAGGLGPQSGGPGVAGTGGANSGVGVLGQGGPPEPGNPGGPGVKGIGGANSSSDNADGVQGFASGTFSGVAGFGGGQSGTGVFGLAAVPLGQAFGASARAVRTRSRPVRLACMARAPRRAPGWSGRRGPAPADGVQGFASGANSGVAGFGGDDSGSGVFGLGGGPAGPGVRGIGAGGPITPSDPSTGVYGQGGPQSSGVVGHGGDVPAGMTGFGGTGVAGVGGQPVGTGVFGVGNVGVHDVTRGADGDTAVLAASGPNGIGIFASAGEAGFFAGDVATAPGNLTVEGNLSVTGAKSALVPFPDGSRRQLYCMESPESWFEDFSFGHLTKTSVKEVAFSYRVVARRKDIAAARLAKVDMPTSRLEEIKARLAKIRLEAERAITSQR
jgi:hypothetical protein